MNAITTTAPPGQREPPIETERLVSRVRSAAEWKAGRYSISSLSAPSPDERRTLTRRADELRIGLTPAETDDIATEVLQLFAGYPSLRLTHEEAARTTATFVAALTGLPLWAIRKACRDWATGRAQASNPSFPPSAPELRIAADAVARPRQHEAGSIQVALNAEVEPELPTERERRDVIARWKGEIRPVIQRATSLGGPSKPKTVKRDPAPMHFDNPEEYRREQAAQLSANDRCLRRELEQAGADPTQRLTPATQEYIAKIVRDHTVSG